MHTNIIAGLRDLDPRGETMPGNIQLEECNHG